MKRRRTHKLEIHSCCCDTCDIVRSSIYILNLKQCSYSHTHDCLFLASRALSAWICETNAYYYVFEASFAEQCGSTTTTTTTTTTSTTIHLIRLFRTLLLFARTFVEGMVYCVMGAAPCCIDSNKFMYNRLFYGCSVLYELHSVCTRRRRVRKSLSGSPKSSTSAHIIYSQIPKLILVQCFRWHETTLRAPLQFVESTTFCISQ